MPCDDMDKLEHKLGAALQGIPSGGGIGGATDYGAYGKHREAREAAKLIRRMIEQAVKERQ